MLDLLVIGGGPAGVAGAVQAQRSGLDTLLVERDQIGGLIWNANLVENHPGLPRPMDGPSVARLLQKHLERTGVPHETAEIIDLRREDGLFHADTCSDTLTARTVLLATGSRPRPLSLPGEEDAHRQRVLYYEVGRLPRLTKSSKVLIVGGGDAAFDYALTCARWGVKSAILIRRAEPKCLPLLMERTALSEAVGVITGIQPLRIRINEGRAVLICRREGHSGEVRITGDVVLVAAGRDPDASLAKGLDPLRPGCYDDDPADGAAGLPELYLAGDAAHGRFRQMTIAAGEGVLAAMHAAARLAARNNQSR